MDALDKRLDRRDANQIGEKRKYVFHATRVLAFAGFGALAIVVVQEMVEAMILERWSALGPTIYPLIVMFWRRAGSSATWICRKLGLSLDGITRERLERVDYENVAVDPIPEPFRVERSCKALLPVCLTLLCFICIGPSLFLTPHTLTHFEHTLSHTLIFSFLAATAILSWLNIRKPLVKVTAGGIAYCDAFGVTCKYVAWHKLGSCDVVSEHDVFGDVVRQSLILRDTRDKKIGTIWMESNSKGTAVEHTEQIINLIKQRLTVAR
jgi:hypothetical protein